MKKIILLLTTFLLLGDLLEGGLGVWHHHHRHFRRYHRHHYSCSYSPAYPSAFVASRLGSPAEKEGLA